MDSGRTGTRRSLRNPLVRMRRFICAYAYRCHMSATSIRLGSTQKRKLEQAAKLLERRLGRRVSQGQAVEALADAALRRPQLLDQAAERMDLDLRADPFFNPSLVFDLGKTDARTIDKILYGE